MRNRPQKTLKLCLTIPVLLMMIFMTGCETVSSYPTVTVLPQAPLGFPSLNVCIEPFVYQTDEAFLESTERIQSVEQKKQMIVENPSLVSPEIREVESVYLAQELKQILTESNYFSSVTVLPNASRCSDLAVYVRILESDGKEIKLEAKVKDSHGKLLGKKKKTFQYETSKSNYTLEAGTDGKSYYTEDPYHPVLMQISDWIIRSLPDANLCRKMQNLTMVKYANRLAPEIFGEDYLIQTPNGNYQYISLPNQADPFYQAVLNTYSLETSLYENFEQYYSDAHDNIDTPYFQWREVNGEAVSEYRKFKRSISSTNLLGIMAEVLIIAATDEMEDASDFEKVLIVLAFLSQFEKDDYGNIIFDPSNLIPTLEPLVSNNREKSQMAHEYAQKAAEISMTFETNTHPITLELKGRTYVLEGKIEDQFSQLSKLVDEYYREETGF